MATTRYITALDYTIRAIRALDEIISDPNTPSEVVSDCNAAYVRLLDYRLALELQASMDETRGLLSDDEVRAEFTRLDIIISDDMDRQAVERALGPKRL